MDSRTTSACRVIVSETLADKLDRMDHKRRPGRPSKGARHVIVTRPAKPVADLVMERAAEAGLSISEYVAGVLAHAHGMSEYAPAPQVWDDQQELPLKTA